MAPMVVLAIQVGALLSDMGVAPDGATRAYTVLVVDDEPDIRSAVKHLLERALRNVKVITAEDGYTGLRILQSTHIDLILTDYKMPGMNGYEFIQEAIKVSPKTPRILITAFERELTEERTIRGTFDKVFTKPLDPRPLVRSCQLLLSPSGP